MSADVDCRDNAAAARIDGYGDGAEPGLEFLVDDGIAVFPDLEDGLLDLRNPG